ncbi:MAG TPA: VWA domain-containing protein [Bacteroidales bacterium]|nr:VWA domain-containing protein [Bacteroidales bacterium]HOR81996.1 VWA domain-containing protein [Bacteroidales bacterium]HPJ91272.1 VWA domain-containing protein [Bacteroidales bacterium]
MDKKHQVHNLIILDESGSMNNIKQAIIDGFNELVQTIHGIEKKFPEQKHFISFITFNSLEQKWLHFMQPASKLKQIDDEKYKPGGFTPLFDTMGLSFQKLKTALENESDYDVLVTILTDGLENASKEYTGNNIKKIIKELKQNRWTFTYIGTDHDIEKTAISLSITNTLAFKKDKDSIQKMFNAEKIAVEKYCKKLHSEKKDFSKHFDSDDKIEKS